MATACHGIPRHPRASYLVYTKLLEINVRRTKVTGNTTEFTVGWANSNLSHLPKHFLIYAGGKPLREWLMLYICTYVHYFSSVSVSLLTNHGDETVSRVSPAPPCDMQVLLSWLWDSLWLTLPVNSSGKCSKRGHSHEGLPLPFIEIWIVKISKTQLESPFYQNLNTSER